MSPRYWWQALAALLLLLAVLGMTAWSMRDRLAGLSQPVTRVFIDGQLQHMRDAAVVDALRPLLGQHFFDLDVATARARVLALPWVSQATVRKRWPDGLAVFLHERTAVARWGVDALVDGNGQVFKPKTMEPAFQQMPLLGAANPALAPSVLDEYRSWDKQLASDNSRIQQLVRDARGSWRLQLADGLTLLLGRDQADKRLQRYLKVVVPALGVRLPEAARIDLRYRDGFAVAWRGDNQNEGAGGKSVDG